MANFALTETPINIGISNRPPREYMARVSEQISSMQLTLGEITDQGDLQRNLAENAVPASLGSVSAATYPEFLRERRRLMAAYIRDYFARL